MVNIIVDTGFWRALCDPNDAYYDVSLSIHEKYFGNNGYRVLIPYPSMYELINTKFVKNKNQVKYLDKEIADSNTITKVYDEKYRDLAYKEMVQSKRTLSLVDCIIRAMVEDDALKIKGLVTFNVGDFCDICRKKSIEIILSSDNVL